MMPATHTIHQVHGPRGPVSTDTARRRLRAAGLRNRRPYVGPILTPRHRQRCQQWAQQHQQWRRVQWQDVLFTDDSRYNLFNADGLIRVWRRRHERYSDCCVNAAIYQNDVINNHVVPFFAVQPRTCACCSKTMPGLARPGQHRRCWLSTTSQRCRGRPYHRTWHLSNKSGMKTDVACRLADIIRISRRWRQHWCTNGTHFLRHSSNGL